MQYDVAVVGAGIAGCACAYFLHQAGLKVLLIDKDGIASGGSGAAGAFISPKIEKSGALQQLSQKAYNFSLHFYKTYFPELIHIAKLHHIVDGKETLLDESGLVEAQKVCEALVEGVTFMQKDVEDVTTINAKKIILATGAYPSLFKKPYISLRAIFGHRIDIITSTPILHHYHEKVSISQSRDGRSSIGATHDVHMSFSDIKSYDFNRGREELLSKAAQTLHLQDVKVVQDYIGFRSGSNDYMPHLGKFVDEETTIKKYPQIVHGRYYKELLYHEDIYTLNGLGGYGFVLAPYLADILTQHIVKAQELPSELLIERFFRRWVKRR